MGLYLFSYGVDIDKVKQVFASKDAQIFHAIRNTETFIRYAEQDSAGDLTTEEALRQIIYGEEYNKQSAHSYGYALICICNYLGVDLTGNSAIRITYVTDLIDEYLLSDFGVEGIDCYFDLCVGGIDLGLPPNEGFPEMGILQKEDIEMLYNQLNHIDITDKQIEELLDERAEKGEAYEGIKSLKVRIDYCYHHQLQLVSFCH